VPIVGLPVDRGGVLAGGDRLLKPPQLRQSGSRADQRTGFDYVVTEAAGGVPANGQDGQPVLAVKQCI
jgi:hypothetical protein